MSIFSLVFEFQSLSHEELKILENLSWQKKEGEILKDSVFLVLRGKIFAGRRSFYPRQLGGVLPFCENYEEPIQRAPHTEVLNLPTQDIARFFLKNPGAQRGFLLALRLRKKSLLPLYQKEPIVISVHDFVSLTKLSFWQELFEEASLLSEEVCPDDLSFAQIFHKERQEREIFILSGQKNPYFPMQAQIHIILEKNREKLIKKLRDFFWPGLVFAFTEKSFFEKKEAFCQKIRKIVLNLKRKENFYFWNEISKDQRELFFSKMNLVSENFSFHILHGLTAIFWTLENFRFPKDLNLEKILQPRYPHEVFYDYAYTLKKLSRVLPKNVDLVEYPIIFAGPLWLAGGELALSLAFSAFTNQVFFKYPQMPLFSPVGRLLRLGLVPSHMDTGYEPNLGPKLESKPSVGDFFYGFLNPKYGLLW